MDGRLKPDPQPENNNDLNDDEIIDLTQIFEGGDDDDIIDLDDILQQPDQALDAPDEPEEAVIPLVDAISTEETADLPEDTDDGIIDLMDMAPVPDEEISTAFVDEEELPDEADDAIIDLMDVSTTLEADMAGPEHPTLQSDEEAQMEEAGVIDLRIWPPSIRRKKMPLPHRPLTKRRMSSTCWMPWNLKRQ